MSSTTPTTTTAVGGSHAVGGGLAGGYWGWRAVWRTAQSQHSHSIVTAQSHDVGGGLARGYWGWLAWVDSLADLGGVGLSAGLAAGAVGGQSPAGGLEKLLHILQ